MTPVQKRRLVLSLPILIAVAVGGGFWAMLSGMREGRFDPRAIETPATKRRMPEFNLPGLMPDEPHLSHAILATRSKPVLINFFASWCIPCITELPELQSLSHEVTIWGIAYKDRPGNARALVLRNNKPYEMTAQDVDGNFGIQMGINGVPESFLVMPDGRIVWHDPAPITAETIRKVIRPLLKAAP
ncbi:Cytochrome c biogenesis protein CcmG [Acetobacteraceae bacterium EV16G]|uniref:Cytochrome c biogenesis protein CcmG n=1 Tax=Sorlinia euscelidii TaxID=3081148 RepID=A0ABU7U2B9_9PROT